MAPPPARGAAGADGAAGGAAVAAACREVAREHLPKLFPEGRVPVTDDAVERHSNYEWVRILAAADSEPLDAQAAGDRDHLPEAWLPARRREIARRYLEKLCGAGGALVTQDTVERSAASQGWVLRKVEASERAQLEQVRAENSSAREALAFMVRTTGPPSEGHGDWYECELSRDLPTKELEHVVTLAEQHPHDVRALETACQVLAKAAAAHPLLLAGDGAAAGGAAGGRRELLRTRGVSLAVGVLRRAAPAPGGSAAAGPGAARLQWRACQALWHLAAGGAGARAADAAGAVGALPEAMGRFPGEKALQWAACAALANIAAHREDPWPEALTEEAVAAAAAAMVNFPKELDVQEHACAFLWRVAILSPASVESRPGLRAAASRAAALGGAPGGGGGAAAAGRLLAGVRWRSWAEAHMDRGAGRRRWGQWAAGPTAAA